MPERPDERVKRCVIHHATPSGKVYPFCIYNSGPYFREKIEKEFFVPFDLKAAKASRSSGKKLLQIAPASAYIEREIRCSNSVVPEKLAKGGHSDESSSSMSGIGVVAGRERRAGC